MFTLLASVVIRAAAVGTSATFNGGEMSIVKFSPDWGSAYDRHAWAETVEWTTNATSAAGRWKLDCLKASDLQCLALSLRFTVLPVAGREWKADDRTYTVPGEFRKITLADGRAKRFEFPLPGNETLVVEFAEPVGFHAQDGRGWNDQWSIRFGPHQRRTVHPKGESIVFAPVFSSPDGLSLRRPAKTVIRENGSWAKFENRRDIVPGSALDFSGQGLVDAPAGKYGWLKSVGGTFEFTGRPGTAQRFYGVNLCFTACYPTHETADIMVDRFVRLGYNTLRIHHHDDIWAHRPEMRERLDYLIAKAIGKGLYITTDLYVSRSVKWREIGVDRDGEVNKQLFKSLAIVNEKAYRNWCAFAKDFLEHVNPYTGRAYRDEPGMPLLSLINEGNLSMGWGESGKTRNPELLAEWRKFTGDDRAEEVPSPWADDRAKKFDDELNRRFFVKAAAYVRSLGAKALLTNDNNGQRHGEGEASTPLMDYVDNHFYIDHPEFIERSWQLPSRCANANPVRLGQPKIFAKGYAKDASKPYAITEWNFSGPGRYRALGGVLTGALAARDRWDALWRFAYSHNRDNLVDGPNWFTPGYFDCATDPLNQASDRASSLLFLRGDALDGEIVTDEKEGSMRFVSPRTCGGFAERGGFAAGPLEVSGIDTSAAVWVSSLDGAALAESKRMLLVHITDVQGDGAEYADEDRKIILKWGKGCLLEKGRARITLKTASPCAVYRLDTTGKRLGEVKVSSAEGALSFDISTSEGTIYYEISEL